jgi:NTE family protein
MGLRSRLLVYSLLFSFLVHPLFGQRVGVVLSGGGADGLAHIGVLKALDEHNIPIDYICGTSIGALIGALYASGISPAEIEAMYYSDKFQKWSNGELEDKHNFYFVKKEPDASWINLKFSPDTFILTSLPTNVIWPVPLDYGMMEFFGNISAAANYKFDNLMIPFRCVASNITLKCESVLGEGDLGQSIRASMSYPFYLKPLMIDGNLYVDGGLYNNFPVDVMHQYFQPDIIIGSNVSESVPAPSEDDLISQVKSMLINRDPLKYNPENTILIMPPTGMQGMFDFTKPAARIQAGFDATMETMPRIETLVNRRMPAEELAAKRSGFKSLKKRVYINELNITGVNSKQSRFVEKSLGLKGKTLHLDDLKTNYFRLVSSPKVAQIHPTIIQKNDSLFRLNLRVKKEKAITTYFGGNFSSRPVNAAHIGAQYTVLGRLGYTIYANSYFGRFYGSYHVKGKVDVPGTVPFAVEASFTRNRWDFFRSSTAFFEDVRPSFLLQNENQADVNLSLPVFNKGKLRAGLTASNLFDRYYQTRQFTQADTTDRTDFLMLTPYIEYERNSLNRKQFASAGSYFSLKYRWVFGNEINNPGTTSPNQLFFTKYHEWQSLRLMYEQYYKQKGRLRLGFYAEGVLSNQPFFNNYTSTMLIAPAFQPIPESRTLFLDNFRAHNYAAFGLKNVIEIIKNNLDLRLEAYAFQAQREILRDELFNAYYSRVLSKRYFIGSAAMVFHSPVGPLSVNVNYYQGRENPVSVLFTFGYILFNRRSLE